MALTAEAYGLTDVGRKRQHNEDAFAVDRELGLFVVADGMGGHAAGEVASERAVEVVRQQLASGRQVLEDLGYVTGECEHNYRTVMFRGKAGFVTDANEKRRALGLMIDKLEEKPGEAKKRLITQSSLEKASIVRVRVLELSGKESLHK